MGYHVINIYDNIPCFNYFETVLELEESGCLKSSSYIFEGKEKHSPKQIGKDSELYYLTKEEFIAGKKAESLFKTHAFENGVNLLEIPQDKKFFTQRNNQSKVKRSDYITTSLVNNYQIEVKCLSTYPLFKNKKENEDCIYFSIEQLERHKNMEIEEYKYPTIIACYERRGIEPINDSMRMISISDVLTLDKRYEDKKKKAFKIPLSKMTIGFNLLLQSSNNSSTK